MALDSTLSFGTFFWAVVGAGGGGAAMSFALIRAFGSRWLDSKFDSRLQALRHEHERQMESVRLEASRLLDRSVRLSEREFEVSAEAWALVFDAYVQAASAMPGFRRYPDLARASDEAVRHILEGGSFDEFEIAELLSKPPADRNSFYSDRKEVHQLWDAKRAVREATNYLAKKALFIEKDVHDRLTGFVDGAWRAVVDWEFVREMRGQGPLPDGIRRDDEAFRQTAEAKVKELELFVRERFWERNA